MPEIKPKPVAFVTFKRAPHLGRLAIVPNRPGDICGDCHLLNYGPKTCSINNSGAISICSFMGASLIFAKP